MFLKSVSKKITLLKVCHIYMAASVFDLHRPIILESKPPHSIWGYAVWLSPD